jgi:hypothetical protein
VFNTQNGSPDATEMDETVASATNGSLIENSQAISATDVTKLDVPLEKSTEAPVANENNKSTKTTEEKYAGTNGTGKLLNKEPELEEDLLADQSIQCNGCDKVINNWKDGPLYLCVTCTDTDLYTTCYNKRVTSNRGGEWTEWQTFCGPHHRYIKGPMKDWKGVKDGIIRFGEEKMPFTEWLKGLNEKRWRGAWVNWWQQDDLVDDIL